MQAKHMSASAAQGAALSERFRLRAVALVVVQLTAGSALVGAYETAFAQCTGAIGTPTSTQDDGEGANADPAPQTNSQGATSTSTQPNSAEANAGTQSGGDKNDGGGAKGNPGGVDGNGGDAGSSSTSVSSIWAGPSNSAVQVGSGWETSSDVLSFQPDVDRGRPHWHPGGNVLDPIDVAHADKVHVQVDYLAAGAAPLRLARVYHSNNAVNTARVTVPMGAGWHLFYDRSLEILASNQIRLHRANGQTLDFTYDGSHWATTLPAGVLTTVSGGWQYVDNRDFVETYNSSGRLVSLASGGLSTALNYDANGRLVSVVNPFGKQLTFAYDASNRVSAVTLPNGSKLAYAYDTQNNLTSVTFADGAVRQYLYENSGLPHAMTGVIDESGRRRLTWGYDAAGRPTSGYYGQGTGAVTAVYNGSQVTTTDTRGTQRTRSFVSVAGRTVLAAEQTAATADSAATGWSFSYDANGNPLSATTRTGEVQQFSYDARGRVLSETHAYGTAVAFTKQVTWDATYNKPRQIVAGGVTRTFSLDAYGRVTQVVDASGGASHVVSSATYNAQNLLATQTDARGNTTTFTYDASGNLYTSSDSLGHTAYYSNYTADGQPQRIQQPDGTVETRSYNVRGLLTSVTNPGGTTSYTYDAAGRVASVTNPDGSWLAYAYDQGGFLSSVTNNRGEKTVVSRDSAGVETGRTVYNASNSVAAVTQRLIDAVGRVSAVVDSRGYATHLLYDGSGRWIGTTDPVSITRTQQLDALNRVTALTVPNTAAGQQAGGGATTTATVNYDSQGNRSTALDMKAVSTGYAYNGFHQRTGEAGADPGSIGYVRNSAGDVTSMTDALGMTYNTTRDLLGRPTSVSYAGSTSPIATYSYVPNRPDALLASMTDAGDTTTWSYDAAGRLLQKQQTTSGVTMTLKISRDAIGRPTLLTYPSGMQVGINYSNDVVSSITVNGSLLISNISYLPFSNTPTGWTWGNGTTYRRSFDADGRVTSVTLGPVARSYAYDAAGRIVQETDTSASGTKTSSFGYDEAGQLISASGWWGSNTYAYDTNGNRLGGSTGGVSYATSFYSGSNQIGTVDDGSTTNYYSNGSPKTYKGFTMYYGDFGRLREAYKFINGTPMVQYGYNGLGQRTYKLVQVYNSGTVPMALPKPRTRGATTQSGFWTTKSTVRFLYDDGTDLLGEYNSTTGYSQETVWFQGQPIATVQGGAVYYVNADNLGAPRSIVRPSDNAEVWHWDGEPFGSSYPTIATITYNLRFPGQYYDGETHWMYNGARDYDPGTGRYIEADPKGLAAGGNRYSFVHGNPLVGIDPLGLDDQKSVSIGGTVFALMGGLGVNYSVGYSTNGTLGGTSLFFTQQYNALAGAGAFVGAGATFGGGHTDGPLQGSKGWDFSVYAEGDLGWSESVSVSGNFDRSTFSLSLAPRSAALPGVGYGAALGVGFSASKTYVSPSVSQVISKILQSCGL